MKNKKLRADKKRFHLLAVLLFTLNFLFATSQAAAQLKNGMPADVVLGQQDFNSNVTDRTDKNLSISTLQITTDGIRLVASDFSSSRVMIWNTIPDKNFAPADVVIGEASFETNTVAASQQEIMRPDGALIVGDKLFIGDDSANRILIWTSFPTVNFAPADLVLGQTNFTANGAGVSQTAFTGAGRLASDGTRFAHATGNGDHRVLIWNNIPTRINQPADLVLGQPNFTSNTANNGGVSARSVNNPRGISLDGKRLYVTGQGNNRVLIWNSVPNENFAPADLVLGQNDFVSNGAGSGRVGMSAPTAVFSDGQRLYVADRDNHRVLVWNQIPTRNNQPADIVLGQPDFGQNTAGISQAKMTSPRSITSDGRNLFVVDGASRILIFRINESSEVTLGPQFSQGKAVVGKVFVDWDGDGWQDA